MGDIEKFKRIYNEVFDKNGNIMACGRQKCKELIAAANDVNDLDIIAVNENKYYGDIETGRLNIGNVQALHSRINLINNKE